MALPNAVIFSRGASLYAPGMHRLPPAEVGAGYQCIAMTATKVDWPKGVLDLFVGHIDISRDCGQSWSRMATWRDDGRDVRDQTTGRIVECSFIQLYFSARREKPVYTHAATWVRGSFECLKPITTAITIERHQ
jgi:hypothetical protein